MLVIFGGQVAKDGSTSNDLFWMTLDRMEWHLHPVRGDKPQPRCVFGSGNKLSDCSVLEYGRISIFARCALDGMHLNSGILLIPSDRFEV